MTIVALSCAWALAATAQANTAARIERLNILTSSKTNYRMS
jgi:hypothetical protein